MQAEDLIVNESGQGEVIEEISEELPHIGVAVLPQAFVVEAVNLSDLAGFVVSSQDGDALGISNLESDKKRYRFD